MSSLKWELVVHGYIYSMFPRKYLLHKIIPNDIVNLIFKFSLNLQDCVSVGIIGNCYSGKSTLCTKILNKCKIISDATIEKARKWELEHFDDESNFHAFCMHLSYEERAIRGSIHGNTKYQFTIGHQKYGLIDIPGGKIWYKNAIKLLSLADVAVLVVPIDEKSFKSSIQTTINHVLLCRGLQIKQLIVVYNKMDLIIKNANQRFIECKNRINSILNEIGYDSNKIISIPISALYGENINNKSYLKWYTGYTLFDALQNITPNIVYPMDRKNESFKMSVSNYWKVKGVGSVIFGRVICGEIEIGDSVKPWPSGYDKEQNYWDPSSKKEYTWLPWIVKSIHKYNKSVQKAQCGDIVSLNVKNVNGNHWYYIKHKRQMVSLDGYLPILATTFRAFVVVSDYVSDKYKSCKYTKLKNGYYCYKNGFTANVFVSTWYESCQLIEIHWKKKSNDKNIQYIQHGDCAQVTFKPMNPFLVYPYNEISCYGRIIVMNHRKVAMIGKILSVNDHDVYQGMNALEIAKYKIDKEIQKKGVEKLDEDREYMQMLRVLQNQQTNSLQVNQEISHPVQLISNNEIQKDLAIQIEINAGMDEENIEQQNNQKEQTGL
eukprot:372635_1